MLVAGTAAATLLAQKLLAAQKLPHLAAEADLDFDGVRPTHKGPRGRPAPSVYLTIPTHFSKLNLHLQSTERDAPTPPG
jgi:hypothetical protein